MGIKIAFASRSAAREFIKGGKGKIKDCADRPYMGKRWVVVI